MSNAAVTMEKMKEVNLKLKEIGFILYSGNLTTGDYKYLRLENNQEVRVRLYDDDWGVSSKECEYKTAISLSYDEMKLFIELINILKGE